MPRRRPLPGSASFAHEGEQWDDKDGAESLYERPGNGLVAVVDDGVLIPYRAVSVVIGAIMSAD
jgi:hypothetical protein